MLFDQIKRIYKGPAGYSEPEFDYLNRSARKDVEKIRCFLEKWFSYVPNKHKNELLMRFRSSDNFQHRSAFFELYLHELLIRLGYDIEIHPKIERLTTHPDFRVALHNEQVFYLECTLAIGSHNEISAKKREDIVYDVLDRMNSPNFFIDVEVVGSLYTPPPGAKWRKFLEKKLSELDPDKIGSLLEAGGLEALPSWEKKHNGWNVVFRPIPKTAEIRGEHGIRPIGSKFFGVIICKDHIYIRNAIKEKATKYGGLNLPYIIAINVMSDFCNEIAIKEALFGEENITFVKRADGKIYSKPRRNPNGAWVGPQGPQNKRVSGVLIFNKLSPCNISLKTPVLWHNPWAKKPLSQNIWQLPQKIPNIKINKMEFKKGKKNCKIFNIPPE